MPATYEKIATTTVSGSTTNAITFSTIPATYTDLRIVIAGSVTVADTVRFRINGDTGTNYSYTRLYGDGTSAASIASTSATEFRVSDSDWSTTLTAMNEIDIFSYAGSTNKTLLSKNSADFNGSGRTSATVALWRSTAAITSVSYYVTTATRYFTAGTTATLYGILKA